jgi:hypothetical protein
MKEKIPEFCDFDCPFADFPPAETAGICRTMSAVWCKKLRALTNKNTRCEWRKRQRSSGTEARRGKAQSTAKPKKRAW